MKRMDNGVGSKEQNFIYSQRIMSIHGLKTQETPLIRMYWLKFLSKKSICRNSLEILTIDSLRNKQ